MTQNPMYKKYYREQISTNTRNDTHLNYATLRELVVGMHLEQDGEYYRVMKVENRVVTLKNMRTDEYSYEPENFFNNAKFKKVSISGNYTF